MNYPLFLEDSIPRMNEEKKILGERTVYKKQKNKRQILVLTRPNS